MSVLRIHTCGPGVTVQDSGWSGTLALGLSRGGVADTRAYAEAQALMGARGFALLEMAGSGGTFSVSRTSRIALTGAPMRCTLDGTPLVWGAVHRIEQDQVLSIGAAQSGVYGYLSVGGGLDVPHVMGSASTHRATGLGHVACAGDEIALLPDSAPERHGLKLFRKLVSSTPIRLVPSAQTDLFDTRTVDLFESTEFTRGLRGNRQGVVIESQATFALEGGQSIPSETILPGDIQVPGNGVPLVLLADCQTTGGYPRIASVLPCDLPRVAQAEPGTKLRFKMISRQDGVAAERAEHAERTKLITACQPIVRDPAQMSDLLGYNLISGVRSGYEED